METENHGKWSLVGIPDHEGVLRVGGRLGAAFGPDAFRKVFSRLKGQKNLFSSLVDAGNSSITSDIQVNHSQAAEKIAKAHAQTGLSVVVGGGHDHGYSHLLGIKKATHGSLGCINIDAHLDVRKPDPEITSGSPFYLALEEKVIEPKHLIEFGIQRHCNSEALWKYVESKKVEVVLFEEMRLGGAVAAFQKQLKKLSKNVEKIVISLDIDAVSEAYAPGVSAPAVEGFTPSELLEMMKIAASEPKVISLGIFELNPEHDVDQKTTRLCATAAWNFIAHRLGF